MFSVMHLRGTNPVWLVGMMSVRCLRSLRLIVPVSIFAITFIKEIGL